MEHDPDEMGAMQVTHCHSRPFDLGFFLVDEDGEVDEVDDEEVDGEVGEVDGLDASGVRKPKGMLPMCMVKAGVVGLFGLARKKGNGRPGQKQLKRAPSLCQ